jgi:uncharacterized delta-60 repeat protein
MNAILCRALSLLVAATVCRPLLAGIGDIDPAFGNGGMLNAGLIAVLPDGKLLMTTADGYARKMPDGKPDLGFGVAGLQGWPSGFVPNSWVSWRESLSVTTPDGSTLVAGHIIDVGSNRYEGALARLQPGGGIDTTFGEQGMVRLPIPGAPPANDSVHMPEAVTIQPDGRILVLSLDYREYWSEEGTVYLQRFESDGRRDPAFGIGGELKPGISMSEIMGTERMQYLRDGRIKLGEATYLDELGQPQDAPTASSIPDTANPGWFTVGRMPGGDSIVAHLGNDSAFSSALQIARVDRAGRPVASFGQEGTGMSAIEEKPGGWIFSSSVSPDGRFAYLASRFEPLQGQPYSVIERIALEGPGSGRLDPSFGKSGQMPMNPGVTGLNIFRIIGQADGSVIVGGYLRTLRLLGSPGTAPGVIGPKSSGWVASAGASGIELVFSRFGGTDGTVGLHYETYSVPSERPTEVLAAVAGTDYTARSGTVEWTNGDSSDKSVFIDLLPGVQSSLARVFHVRIDQPSGGALLSAGDSTATLLTASAVSPISSSAPTQAFPGNPSPIAQGGGGALDLLMLSFWLLLLGAGRNHFAKIQGQGKGSR